MRVSPWIFPSESRVPRCTHRSRQAWILSPTRHNTRSSSSKRTAIGLSALRSGAYATTCQSFMRTGSCNIIVRTRQSVQKGECCDDTCIVCDRRRQPDLGPMVADRWVDCRLPGQRSDAWRGVWHRWRYHPRHRGSHHWWLSGRSTWLRRIWSHWDHHCGLYWGLYLDRAPACRFWWLLTPMIVGVSPQYPCRCPLVSGRLTESPFTSLFRSRFFLSLIGLSFDSLT